MGLAFYKVTLASGKSVIVDAYSPADAEACAMLNAGGGQIPPKMKLLRLST